MHRSRLKDDEMTQALTRENGIPQLLTIAQVADCLHLGITKVYEILRSGELPSVPIGGAHRVSAAQLNAYVERLESEAQ
jgi:excisionase family DNA binding protein